LADAVVDHGAVVDDGPVVTTARLWTTTAERRSKVEIMVPPEGMWSVPGGFTGTG
jgi:hypothetical protein